MIATAPATIQLYETQADFVYDQSPFAVFLGGRNSGKTHAGAVKAALRCFEPGLGFVAAPNFPMLEHAAKRKFLERLDALGLRYVEHKSLNTLTIPDTGAEVVFGTLETESRIRGPGFDWAWPDEIEYIGRRSTWLALKGSIREGRNPQLFATTTPRGRRLVWEEFVRDASPEYALYAATTYDNPFIDAGRYVRSLRYSGQFYAQEIEAKFVSFEGLVYPAFDRMTQVRAVECADWPVALGLDIGARSPTALMTMRYSGDRLHVERELYQREMGNPEIVDAVIAEYERTDALFVVVDPEAGNLVLDLQRKGLHVRKAQKAVTDGINRVLGIIPDLTIDPSCVNTLVELESYQYPPSGEKDQPQKANDHLMDSLRYLTMELTKPRKRFRVY